MKYTLCACALALLTMGCSFQTEILVGESSDHARPKLVVGITVDQMRSDYLTRFGVWDDAASPATFGEGGFRRMVEEGFTCRDHHFGYAPTYTGPGHASIYTGTTPKVHGIIGNDWYDRASGTSVYCASDTSVKGVNGDGVDFERLVLGSSGQMSPHRMLSTTLGDELKMATGGQAKVYGASMKDRGAILPAGHGADGAFWFYGKDLGHFVSSTYYADTLPLWVVDLNRSGRAEALMGDGWDRLRDESVYSQCLPDNNPYEGAFRGELRPTFPYAFRPCGKKMAGTICSKARPGATTSLSTSHSPPSTALNWVRTTSRTCSP